MKKKLFKYISVLGLTVLPLLAGCLLGKTKFDSPVPPKVGSKVVIGSVSNVSGKTFDIDIEQRLRDALSRSLDNKGIYASDLSTTADFKLNVYITRYAPGNAFKRWLVPGYGSTLLTVQGELQNAKDGSRVLSTEHQRIIWIGGGYTIGAWSFIIGQVANDLAHDLKLRIEKGPDFVITLAPPSADAAPVEPTNKPTLVSVPETIDERAEHGRIGERFAAFGVSMGDVYFFRNVNEFFREALADEVQLMGNKVVPSGENVKVTAKLTKFWVTTKTTPLYWDIIAEVKTDFIFETAHPTSVKTVRHYEGQNSEHTYVWPTSSLMGKALKASLDDTFAKMKSDEVWKSFPPNAKP